VQNVDIWERPRHFELRDDFGVVGCWGEGGDAETEGFWGRAGGDAEVGWVDGVAGVAAEDRGAVGAVDGEVWVIEQTRNGQHVKSERETKDCRDAKGTAAGSTSGSGFT